MRFDAEKGGASSAPPIVAFALKNFDRGDSYFFDWFGYQEGLPPGDYTLHSGDKRITVVLPEEATRQAFPGHLLGESVRKGHSQSRE